MFGQPGSGVDPQPALSPLSCLGLVRTQSEQTQKDVTVRFEVTVFVENVFFSRARQVKLVLDWSIELRLFWCSLVHTRGSYGFCMMRVSMIC